MSKMTQSTAFLMNFLNENDFLLSLGKFNDIIIYDVKAEREWLGKELRSREEKETTTFVQLVKMIIM